MKFTTITEHKLEDGPVFCRDCGTRLERKHVSFGFDQKTGEELFGINLICPAEKWYQSHTREEYTPNGFRIDEINVPL